jgi:NTP pyrophosphatase (non-canonical NTP hydrolase)
MSTNFASVAAMYMQFGMGRVNPNDPPHLIDGRTASFRIAALGEELEELAASYAADDLPNIADALVDLVVFAMGTAVLHNLPWEELFEEVMRANSSKVTGPGVKVRGYGLPDLLKPEGWKPPDIEGTLQEAGWRPPEKS